MVWGNKNHEGGGKRTNEDNQRKKMSGADTHEADPPHTPPTPTGKELQLTTTCPADSSERLSRYAGRCQGWRGIYRSLWCRSQMCWAFPRNAGPEWAQNFVDWRGNWDEGQTGRNREGVQYLVCFLVFNNTSVVHGLFSVWLQKRTKKLEKKKSMIWDVSRMRKIWTELQGVVILLKDKSLNIKMVGGNNGDPKQVCLHFWGQQQLSRIKSHCCPEDDETVGFSVFLLEAEHLFERKSRADIGIQNEESLRTAGDNLISEVIDAPSGAQGRVLLEVPALRGRDRAVFLQLFCRTRAHWCQKMP